MVSKRYFPLYVWRWLQWLKLWRWFIGYNGNSCCGGDSGDNDGLNQYLVGAFHCAMVLLWPCPGVRRYLGGVDEAGGMGEGGVLLEPHGVGDGVIHHELCSVTEREQDKDVILPKQI